MGQDETLRFTQRMRRERVQAILHETARLIGEQGCVHIRVEDVARRTGIAKGTVYLDFPSKQDLVVAALNHLIGEFLNELDENVSEGTEPWPALAGSVDVLAAYTARHPALAIALPSPWAGPIAGFGYFLIAPAQLINSHRFARRRALLDEGAQSLVVE
jgi:AcrR family transcriptional regulator